MKKMMFRSLLFSAAAALALQGSAQDVDYKKYPDYSPVVKADKRLAAPVRRAGETRPAYVNNALTPYFPEVINQDGGSCGSASRIWYMFTYEINAWRRADASSPDNQYPSHFTWLLTYTPSGKETMAAANGIPNVTTYGGKTYSQLFGNQDATQNDFGWMQGYDKWFAAMHNRIEGNANFPTSVESEAGREAVKNWIWNHNGDPDWDGVGGVCGIGVASGGDWKKIPNTEANKEAGVVGQYYVGNWGKSVDHALTIVGYDDRIEFDLDGNGVAGEKDKDEVGAWIIVNSWGGWWCNKGFIYCPYKKATPNSSGAGYYQPEIYYVRKNYTPLRTLKIKMEYSKRSELCLSAGVAQDTTATEPERSTEMEHFRYAGRGTSETDPEVPMLGRWTDGLHYEPMEFGYDITDISAGLDLSKPVKYFFIIQSKDGANGKGKVHNVSMMDYEFDTEGTEFPFPIGAEGVDIQTQGNKTIISCVVKGETLSGPRNVVIADKNLTWEAPEKTGYQLKGFAVFKDGVQTATLAADATSYTVDDAAASYAVAAIYAYNGSDTYSPSVLAAETTYRGETVEDDGTRKFTASGFSIANVFADRYDQATIEYWVKPTSCSNWNQQIGPGWGQFLIHTTVSGQLNAGWSENNRVITGSRALASGKWSHVAVVVDGNTTTVYINGEKEGECSGAAKGIGGFGNLSVGKAGANGLAGEYDNFRIWSTARTQTQIQQYMYARIADPANTPGLLVDIPMDEPSDQRITDHAKGHTLTMFTPQPTRMTNTTRTDTRELAADFALPEGPVYAQTPLQVKNLSSGNAVSFLYETTDKTYALDAPSIVFSNTGEQNVKLTVKDAAGNEAFTVKTFNVVEAPKPVADFEFSTPTVAVGDRISFVNKSENATAFEWDVPNAVTKKATSTHFTTTFDEPGTFEVTLKATNAAGTTSVTKSIQVNDLWPVADFTVSPNTVLKLKPAKFSDQSTRAPKEWKWEIANEDTVIVKTFHNGNLSLRTPGVFDVRLTAQNEKGGSSKTKKRAYIVCNADSETGLNFYGKQTEYVRYTNPITDKDFTIEFWMYAKGLSDYCNQIGTNRKAFMLENDAEGRFILNAGGNKMQTRAGVVAPSEWHHYAFVVSGADCDVYCDLKKVGTLHNEGGNIFDSMSRQLTLGGPTSPMNAIVDELRIWNAALTLDDLTEYANQPIQNVSKVEADKKLALYYQFNQTSGNVQDACSAGNAGQRIGFGPEGDAWSSSLGVFCLSPRKAHDITADYLTNPAKPFRHTAYSVNANQERFQELETGTPESTWTMQNAVETGDVTTCFFVDKEAEDALALMTGKEGFANQLTNHKLAQTITLPAGYYTFGIDAAADVNAQGAYLAVARGQKLPNTADVEKVLGYAPLADGKVSFSLMEETEVTLGITATLSGETATLIDAFYLHRKGTNDDFSFVFTGVESPAVTTLTNTNSYDLQGRRVLRPAQGIFIQDGRKVMVK